MQIGAATQFASSSTNTNSPGAGAASGQAIAPPASQNDAVQISPQGYAAASTDNTASDETDAASTPPSAQPVKSLVYGALGLERPDAPADPNRTYTLGRWIAAGITLGGVISLFV
ncbi:hypothetical protein [Paraburkholderia sp. J76]|uniref:hypothetical protein n=1 Tax=Paraburkholderia sp. J76 TaxID=2805439 RepID=UPI002ABE154D|nr:hypothetical protein [Paraburkholderia sp. J76]